MDTEYLPPTKRCKKCGQVKSTAEFSIHGTTKDGYQNRCNTCRNKARKHTYRDQNLQHNHGISEFEFDLILKRQGGICLICGLPPILGQRMHLDHDHKTNTNRAVVHLKCNMELGKFEKNPDFYLKVLPDYLRRFK